MTDEIIEPVVAIPEVVEPSWFLDEGRPGEGNRPDWLDSKFKTAADLAKSYRELEKKISTAPEDYDLSQSKFLDGDYEPIQDFLKLAKDKRVPKDVVDKMVESIDKYMDEFSIDYTEEAKKLGDDAQSRLTTLDNWAQANLSKDSYEALTSNLKTASAIKALEELRSRMMTNTPTIPNGNDAAVNNVATLDEIRAEISNNLGKYKSDPKYRADITARLTLASKNSNFIDKTGY